MRRKIRVCYGFTLIYTLISTREFIYLAPSSDNILLEYYISRSLDIYFKKWGGKYIAAQNLYRGLIFRET